MSSFLLVGPPGSGKTTAAATLAKLGPVGLIDFDYKAHKMENLNSVIRSTSNPKGNLIHIPINYPLSTIGLKALSTTKLDQGGKQESTQPKGYLKFVEIMDKLEQDKYKWDGEQLFGLILDSYTSMQEHLKRLLLSANSKMTMTLALYGPMLTNLEEVNNIFIRLPIHTIILAHEKLEKDELCNKPLIAVYFYQ